MADWEELNKLKGIFDRIDDDRSGSIDRDEFASFMTAIGKKMSADELDEGFSQIDTDESGVIEFSEFVDWYQDRK